MADEVEEVIENALNLVVSTTEQSGNMKKALKDKIYETVSTLRHLFVKIKISGDRKQSEINNLTEKASKLETGLHRCRVRQEEAHQTPSLANTNERSGQRTRLNGTTSIGVTSVPEEECAQCGATHRQYEQAIRKCSKRDETHQIQDDRPIQRRTPTRRNKANFENYPYF